MKWRMKHVCRTMEALKVGKSCTWDLVVYVSNYSRKNVTKTSWSEGTYGLRSRQLNQKYFPERTAMSQKWIFDIAEEVLMIYCELKYFFQRANLRFKACQKISYYNYYNRIKDQYWYYLMEEDAWVNIWWLEKCVSKDKEPV